MPPTQPHSQISTRTQTIVQSLQYTTIYDQRSSDTIDNRAILWFHCSTYRAGYITVCYLVSGLDVCQREEVVLSARQQQL